MVRWGPESGPHRPKPERTSDIDSVRHRFCPTLCVFFCLIHKTQAQAAFTKISIVADSDEDSDSDDGEEQEVMVNKPVGEAAPPQVII